MHSPARSTGGFGRVLAVIALLLGLAQPVSAAPNVDALTLATALNFRETFGLSTDDSLVTELESDAGSDRKYSVALTSEERANIDARMGIQENLIPLLEYGRRNSATFGGMHVDQADGGTVHFAFTSDLAIHEAALDAIAPVGARLQVRLVSWTEVQLDALVEKVSHDTKFQDSIGVAVHNTLTDIPHNSVTVVTEPYSADVAKRLRERYGAAVAVVPGAAPTVTACSTRQNCPGPPIMAGINNNWGCTMGFGIWEDGQRRFLTAGHCVQQVKDAYGCPGSFIWYHQAVNLGYCRDESWYDYSPADAGTIGNVSSTILSNRVLYSTQPSWFGIHGTGTAGADWVGMAICQSAQVSGYRCGTITSTNSTPNYGGVHMKWQRRANYLIQVGDSGAPVINSANTNQAEGLQSGRDSLYVAYYSHIGYVLGASGINAAIWTYDS